ncbi:MAG: glycosyltransferase family 39 protein [Planctomycetota bacterium]
MQTDTGMWAYIGGRLLDGARLYVDLWESKPPGIYYVFACVEWVFGRGGDRALLWLDAVVSLAVFGLTYRVARRFASRTAAAGAVMLLSVVFCHRILADWGDNVEKFVALFELLACWYVLRAMDAGTPCGTGVSPVASQAERLCGTLVAREGRAVPHWLAAGACCGLAGLFKQTGILFLVAAVLAVVGGGLRRREPAGSVGGRVGLLVGGVAIVWLPVLAWMWATGILAGFWEQAVCYDLVRVGPGGLERSRLLQPEHWSAVGFTLYLVLVLFGPAMVGTAYYVWRRAVGASSASGDIANTDRMLAIVVLYWFLTTALFTVAPHGFGHYLLQAAPAAAVLAAWFFDQTLRLRGERFWATAAMLTIVLGLSPHEDHLRFTFDRNYVYRAAYEPRRAYLAELVPIVQQHTSPETTVMLWPRDHAFSYYAQRVTPLESSNADRLFKGQVHRLRPPMPELLRRLAADPPDVIVDWTPLEARVDELGRLELRLPAAGFSMHEGPDESHAWEEGRQLAPLKRWLRESYGGQERIGRCTFFYLGEPWRSWEEVLLGGGAKAAGNDVRPP